MIREIVPTKDGSLTIAVPEMNATYHSVYGAIRESRHVFIEAGLKAVDSLGRRDTIALFEMGFGTGLNALLTLIEAEKTQQKIYYTAIDLYPLSREEAQVLNYCELLGRPDLKPLFYKFHDDWEEEKVITPFFSLSKYNKSLLDFKTEKRYHLIYFDAFAPGSQPELWTEEVFEMIYAMLHPGGSLVTYCSKGDVRRSMIKSGFSVEKLPGPPGKREIIRASKEVYGL